MHALGICMRALLRAGDEVVVPAPCFFFDGPIRAAGGVPVYVHGSEADGWRWDAEAAERAIGARTTMVLLCNPGNPTGYVPSREDVAAVVACAVEHGLLVLADEAYEAALWGDARLTSASGLADDVVVIRSLGKSLSMPQLRLGIVSGPAARVGPCADTLEWDCLRVGVAAQEAALAALRGPRDWLEAVHSGLLADRTVALAAVAATPGLAASPPAAAPFLFIHAEAGGEVAPGLLDAGLPVVDGARFRAPGYARLVFGGAAQAEDQLVAALARWAATAT
jgi:aspartate/methionine/tyrosine aminotransferase